MQTIFTVCALVGGTALVLQFVLSLIGFGGDGGASGDLGDVAADLDVPDGGADLDIPDGGADVHGHGHSVGRHGSSTQHHHSASGVVKILTFQTVVAFLAFFGLGGLATLQAGHGPPLAVAIAVIAGGASMFALAYVMHGFLRLQADPTVRLPNAVGSPARVYLKIPAANTGAGKVTVTIQGREVELAATTPGPELPTGAAAVVTRLVDGHTLEVVGSDAEQPAPAASA